MFTTFKKSLLGASITAVLTLGAISTTAYAQQQTGSIRGTVEGAQGAVTVTATSNVMPKPRTAEVRADGTYTLPFLLPGEYELEFTAADGTVRRATIFVLLDETANLNVNFSTDVEVINVVGTAFFSDGDSSLSDSLGGETLQALPVGQDYRDILKLIPGVASNENSTLGPNAGGSGRDNTYGFDGVDISLPLFGNLAAEPSTHDIAFVSVDRGGAKAIGFNRSGGFDINTTSKSGTNEFQASVEYRIQPNSLEADADDADGVTQDTERTWITTSVGGPLIEDELFFYGSYYRPEVERTNIDNNRGPVKDFNSTRDEYFGKLTWAPTDELLFNASYRDSDRQDVGLSVGANDADSTSTGDEAQQKIIVIDGSYLVGDYTTVSFAYNKYDLETSGRPDTLFPNVMPALGDSLDLSRLDQLGLFSVPELQLTNPDFDNAAAQVLINQYGFIENGSPVGGGAIGGASTINDQDFVRESIEFSLDHELEIGNTTHFLHFGIQWKESSEELSRTSNGWGSIRFAGGDNPDTYDGDDLVYYQATLEQMSLIDAQGAMVPAIFSKSESINIELHNTIEHGDLTYDIGFLISRDELFGQGLRENADNVSGFELAPGNEYSMQTFSFADNFQPRLGITYQYNPDTRVYLNYAQYNPEASSLARAASWARNTRRSLNVFFDENGDFIGSTGAAGSSGKFFEPGIEPRKTREWTVGIEKTISPELQVSAHLRHRKATHPLEDVPNNARLREYPSPFGGVPEDIAARGLYIPDLDAFRAEVGGSSFVIANIDDSINKYNEASFEAEYFGDDIYLKASYTWSNYYGDYDQDNISFNSDRNLFIGSSALQDSPGRFTWDGKYGKLAGNRPHLLKLIGVYTTSWDATLGAFFEYKDGDVWEAFDGSVYGNPFSSIRFAEPAGSRRETSHWQLDLNYTQTFNLTDDFDLLVQADIFNVFDNQTGYNYDPFVSSDTFGEPRNLINPRRVQLSVNLTF